MTIFPKSRLKRLLIGILLAKLIAVGCYFTGAFSQISGNRILSSIPEARAESTTGETKPEVDAENRLAPAEASVATEAPLLQPGDIKAVMETLEKKRIALQEEEERLKKERTKLESLKQEIESKIDELTVVQKKIEEDLNQKSALAAQAEQKKNMEEEKKIKQLVKVYASMKPKSAAEIVDKMDLSVVLQVFSNMKGEQVGQILSYVNKDRAAKISEWLATKKID